LTHFFFKWILFLKNLFSNTISYERMKHV